MTPTTPTRDRPILFSTEMVRAIFAGRKTMTRRLVKQSNSTVCGYSSRKLWNTLRWDKPVYVDRGYSKDGWEYLKVEADPEGEGLQYRVRSAVEPGDLLWVRETFRYGVCGATHCVQFKADDRAFYMQAENEGEGDPCGIGHACIGEVRGGKWRSPLHMPRWASRLTLEVESVKVERIQDVSADDIRAEGLPTHVAWQTFVKCYRDPDERAAKLRTDFAWLWDTINGKGSWAANPWVFVIGFKVAESRP